MNALTDGSFSTMVSDVAPIGIVMTWTMPSWSAETIHHNIPIPVNEIDMCNDSKVSIIISKWRREDKEPR